MLKQEAYKGNKTFLTLKKKPNNAIKTVGALDNPDGKQPLRSVNKESQKSAQDQTKPTANVANTRNATRSKIPVSKKRRRPKLTFQIPSKRKSSPANRKVSADVTPQKTGYRKTPAAKNGLRKAKARDASFGDEEENDSDVVRGDVGNGTFVVEGMYI